jgi:hypothetical protein
MSAASSKNGGSRRSVTEVVADWRSKRARGEPVDAEALLAKSTGGDVPAIINDRRPRRARRPPSACISAFVTNAG